MVKKNFFLSRVHFNDGKLLFEFKRFLIKEACCVGNPIINSPLSNFVVITGLKNIGDGFDYIKTLIWLVSVLN